MSDTLLVAAPSMRLHAYLLGQRVDLRAVANEANPVSSPLQLALPEGGRAFVFRFGAVVFADADPEVAERFVEGLQPHVTDPTAEREQERTLLALDPEERDQVGPQGTVRLKAFGADRLAVAAYVLAKSVALAHHEVAVARVFDRIEHLAEQLQRADRFPRGKDLVAEIGNVLRIQAQTVGRVEVAEKPELTWDQPELDRLYELLAHEYELHDRDVALTRKLGVITTTAQTFLELLQNRQGLRVEWYIVLLIVFDILLTFYDWFIRAG